MIDQRALYVAKTWNLIEVDCQRFLDGNPSAPPTELLTEEERSYFETILDGLSGNRSWEGMNTTERIVYTGGLVAAAGAA